MTTNREAFLERVRHAVRAGNRPGQAAEIEPRGTIGYQGALPDPLTHFCKMLTLAGGLSYRVQGKGAAVQQIVELIAAKGASRILLGGGPILDSLNLSVCLSAPDREIISVAQLAAGQCREAFFAAEVGISGVDYVIAESGTLVVTTLPSFPRSLSLLPPVHIAVAEQSQLLPDLFDLFDTLGSQGRDPPACLTLITGPSKTGDIELRLVTGVHGPGEVHVIIIES